MFTFFQKKFNHLNKISILRSSLIYNFQTIQNHNPQALVAPVLKSNAYGHGLKIVAPIFDKLHTPFICVDSLFEAWQLQNIGIQTPILILGFTLPENFKIKPIPFHVPLFDLSTAQILNKYQKNINVHLKIDTGMNRFGIKVNELNDFLIKLKKYSNIKISGVYSHLSSADEIDNSKNKQQISLLKKAFKILTDHNIYPQWKHIAASAGSFYIKDPEFNLVRAGVACYGISPIKQTNINLNPVLEFKSTICQVKNIKNGETISYNETFAAPQNMTIGIIGAGYYEGLDRRLSNKGFVTVDGVSCQILGRVCMNITIIDLSKVSNPYIGQECIIYSRDSKQPNSIQNCANICQTIPYDLLVKLNETVKREVVE